MTPTVDSRTGLIRARVAASLVFLLFGTALGAWTARIPAIKHGLGLSDGQLSFALLAFAAGAITGMQVVGRLVDRYGSTKVMVPVAFAESAGLVPPAYAPSLVALATFLFAFGAATGAGPLRGVLFLGVLAFCCLVGEGAAADCTVYLRDSLGSSAGFAAAAFAAFSIM